jgi:hypothetical protein
MKHLVMICSGHVPVIGVGENSWHVNQEVLPFIKYFLPKEKPATRFNIINVVRHFHLAFKGMETEEIYDVLMEQLVGVINGYDPYYKAKVKLAVEKIDYELSKRKQFSATELNRHLEFDCDRHLRVLGRLGFLQTLPGKVNQISPARRRPADS